jgi:hypothetical protein
MAVVYQKVGRLQIVHRTKLIGQLRRWGAGRSFGLRGARLGLRIVGLKARDQDGRAYDDEDCRDMDGLAHFVSPSVE